MRIARWILILLFILTALFQFGFNIIPSLAQTDTDTQEAKSVVEAFLKDFWSWDLNSAVSKISTRYHDISSDGKYESDYSKFIAVIESRMKVLSKKYIDNYISNLQILKIEAQNDEVTIRVQYFLKRFNLETAQNESVEPRNLFSLVKENGSWKITKWRWRGPVKKN